MTVSNPVAAAFDNNGVMTAAFATNGVTGLVRAWDPAEAWDPAAGWFDNLPPLTAPVTAAFD